MPEDTSAETEVAAGGADAYQFRAFLKALLVGVVIVVVGLVALAFKFDALNPDGDAHILTTTVSADTEAFEFTTPAERELTWTMPPGQFSVLGIIDGDNCESQGFESLCELAHNTRLVVKGVARIRIEVAPAGGWAVTVSAVGNSTMDASVHDVRGSQAIQSDQLLQYQSAEMDVELPSRLPFVAETAVLGSDLHQSSTIDGSMYDLWQPVLLSGDVQMIADNRPGREKYLVLEDRLDSGDVLHVGAESDGSADGRDALWGMLSIDFRDEETTSFEVVLHTSLREVSVTRFGAPEGHVIRASNWVIMQKWPNGQYAWVSFASLVLMLSLVLSIAQCFDGCRSSDKTNPSPSASNIQELEVPPSPGSTHENNSEEGAKDGTA